MSETAPRPIPAAAAVTLRGDAVLLIRRGRPPNEGVWSFPGGSVEPGETARETAVRETREETGLEIEIVDVADVVDVIVPATSAHPAFHYVITDFIARPRTGAEPHPGDDAAEARWVPLTDLDRYELTPAMREVLNRALRHLAETGRRGDAETRGGKEEGKRGRGEKGKELVPNTQHSTLNTQHPTPNTQHPISRFAEFALIERLSRLLPVPRPNAERGEIVLGVGDDAAVLAPRAGDRIVATVDTLMEGVHFRRDWSSAVDLGWKALAVNVSDAGAMGAAPWAALVSLALPADVPVEWVEELYRGLAACAERYGCGIAGGDTVGSKAGIAITVALLGSARPEEIRLRSGARPGDLICVTGTLGDSGAGLALLQAGHSPASAPRWERLFRAHLHPEPPLAAARALAASPAVTAMMDLSDGLASDLRHLCARSGTGARVHAADLPLSPEAHSAAATLDQDATEWALRGGEDYQLLFTLAPDARETLPSLLRGSDTSATVVGVITEQGYVLERPDGREEPLSPAAFDHFGG